MQRNVHGKVYPRPRGGAAVFRPPGSLSEEAPVGSRSRRAGTSELPEAANVLERMGVTAATGLSPPTRGSLERLLLSEIKRRIRSAGAYPRRASAPASCTAVARKDYCVSGANVYPRPRGGAGSHTQSMCMSRSYPLATQRGSLTEPVPSPAAAPPSQVYPRPRGGARTQWHARRGRSGSIPAHAGEPYRCMRP